MQLSAEKLGKRFGQRKVFKDISFSLQQGESLAVTGPNGSGKTTLLLTLIGLLRPSHGMRFFKENDSPLTEQGIRRRISLVAPYLSLYDYLSGEENLTFFATLGGLSLTGKESDRILEQVGLAGRGCDLFRTYSSGMKQRLKYAVALMQRPGFLFLDEPTSNLDDDGKQIVRKVIEELREHTILVIATNEQGEYELATKRCQLGN